MAKRASKKQLPPEPVEEEIEEEDEEEEEPEYELIEVQQPAPTPKQTVVPPDQYGFLKLIFKLLMMVVYFVAGAFLFFLLITIALIPLGIFEAFTVWFLRFQGVHI